MTPLDVFWSRCEGSIHLGQNDCCMTLADTIVAAGGPDLMARYRGRYRTRLGFARAFRRVGYTSLADAAVAEFERCGRQVETPKDYNVSVVTYLDGGVPVSSPAFFHSGFWCLRSERGGVCSEGAPDRIWSVLDA